MPKLYGEIMKGEPKNIWQVAKSGLLEAKENNPYQFSITASGKGTNQLHFKVRFYDENKNELGIHYVVAPTTESDFDGPALRGVYHAARHHADADRPADPAAARAKYLLADSCD
ncbi:hypothetical protein HMSSN036_30570 [Paenibacillus macerans]|nr:hypothetical protein HMSSN036_30570 [Paenibacillus macerans]